MALVFNPHRQLLAPSSVPSIIAPLAAKSYASHMTLYAIAGDVIVQVMACTSGAQQSDQHPIRFFPTGYDLFTRNSSLFHRALVAGRQHSLSVSGFQTSRYIPVTSSTDAGTLVGDSTSLSISIDNEFLSDLLKADFAKAFRHCDECDSLPWVQILERLGIQYPNWAGRLSLAGIALETLGIGGIEGCVETREDFLEAEERLGYSFNKSSILRVVLSIAFPGSYVPHVTDEEHDSIANGNAFNTSEKEVESLLGWDVIPEATPQ